MKTIDFSYFIERYNAGEMSNEEEHWFNKELIGNDMLRKEVNLRKITDEVLDRHDVISLRNKLSDLERKREEHVPVRKPRKSVYAKSAALVSVLVLVGSIIMLPDKEMSKEELNSRFYKTYEVATPTRAAVSLEATDFSLGLEYYKSGDYKTAAGYFEKVLDIEPDNKQSEFLYGISKFYEGNYDLAEPPLKSVANDNDNHFFITAQWYLAGCYINTNEKELAINQLEIIINDKDNYFKKDARKLLKSLK